MGIKSAMTALANQVRRLSGETDVLSISAMTAALAGVVAGAVAGGGVNIYVEPLITLVQDMKYVEMINTAQFRFRYKKSVLLLIATGSVAAGSGAYTMNNFLIAHDGTEVICARDQYLGGQVEPDKFKYFGGLSEKLAYISISDAGVLGSTSQSTSCIGGPGTVVQAIEIPICVAEWDNWTTDGTLWGEDA